MTPSDDQSSRLWRRENRTASSRTCTAAATDGGHGQTPFGQRPDERQVEHQVQTHGGHADPDRRDAVAQGVEPANDDRHGTDRPTRRRHSRRSFAPRGRCLRRRTRRARRAAAPAARPAGSGRRRRECPGQAPGAARASDRRRAAGGRPGRRGGSAAERSPWPRPDRGCPAGTGRAARRSRSRPRPPAAWDSRRAAEPGDLLRPVGRSRQSPGDQAVQERVDLGDAPGPGPWAPSREALRPGHSRPAAQL